MAHCANLFAHFKILPQFDLKYRMLRICSTASTGLDILDTIESYTNLESSYYKHDILFYGIFCEDGGNAALVSHGNLSQIHTGMLAAIVFNFP